MGSGFVTSVPFLELQVPCPPGACTPLPCCMGQHSRARTPQAPSSPLPQRGRHSCTSARWENEAGAWLRRDPECSDVGRKEGLLGVDGSCVLVQGQRWPQLCAQAQAGTHSPHAWRQVTWLSTGQRLQEAGPFGIRPGPAWLAG